MDNRVRLYLTGSGRCIAIRARLSPKPVVDFRRGLCAVSGAFSGVLVQIMDCIALYAVRRDRDGQRIIYARKADTIWGLILQHLSPPAKPVLLSHPLLLHPCVLHRPPPFFTQDLLMPLHIFHGTETGMAEILGQDIQVEL